VLDIASIGHFCIDSIFLPNRQAPFTVLGGSAAYVSFAARRLGSRVAVVSKVGGDFPEAYSWWLEQESIDLSRVIKVESAKSTRFELKYNSDLSDRVLVSKSRAPSITIDELSSSLKASVVHIAPIAGEVTYDVVEKLKGCAEVLSFDPQGLVRSFDENGTVSLCPLADKRMLEIVKMYKSTLPEIGAVTGISELNSAIKAVHDCGVEVVIVTLGARGSVLSADGATYNIPACSPDRIVDPTGAGDAFMGGFLAEYVNGRNLLRCACVGSAAASLVVESMGPTYFGDKETIYQRARLLYEKEIKE
jgi:sugar/nucleoside kinase (ribokinase family)